MAVRPRPVPERQAPHIPKSCQNGRYLHAPPRPLLIVGLVAVAAVAACTEAAPDATRSPDLPASIESALLPTFIIRGEPQPRRSLTTRMAELGVPGVSVAVLIDGEIGWARGYGLADVESRRPVTGSTLFQAASISKPIAALAALQLVAEGRVDLDVDVNTYLTSWRVPANEWTAEAPVTLRGLLTHRAGLSVSGFPGYGPDAAVPDATGVLDGRGNTDPVRVVTTPGERWRYSGGGYTVMQQLVADVRGEPFAAVMRKHVLDPIGMIRSTYEQPIPDSRQDDIAKGYRPDGEPVIGGWHTYPEQAAAGLWTTPGELALYAREVQRAWRGESARVLTETLAREMLTPDEDGWGLGPGISEDGERFRHGGSNQGFRSTFAAYIDGDDRSLRNDELRFRVRTGARKSRSRWRTRTDGPGPGPGNWCRWIWLPKCEGDTWERMWPPSGESSSKWRSGSAGWHSRGRAIGRCLWALNDSTYFDVEDGREVRFSTDGDGIELVLGTLRAPRAGSRDDRRAPGPPISLVGGRLVSLRQPTGTLLATQAFV